MQQASIGELAGAGPHYWGHPPGREYVGLAPTKPRNAYAQIAERRIAESLTKGPQPVWKLTGVGAVGSQSMLGIARLEHLRTDPRFADDIAIWPFETDFERNLSRAHHHRRDLSFAARSRARRRAP